MRRRRLVRWQHPQRGMISPASFIPLFEINGKICKLDIYVFEKVCETMCRWKKEGRELFPVSVNLSVQHFRNKNFLERYCAIAEKYDIPTNLLELELTETAVIDDALLQEIKEQIAVIHEKGFRFVLDDFGDGISSLNLFRQLDVDVIKLDRGLATSQNDEKGCSIITAIVWMARKLGVQIVAEGIETEEQLRCAENMQCNSIQGFYYSRPLDIASFENGGIALGAPPVAQTSGYNRLEFPPELTL